MNLYLYLNLLSLFEYKDILDISIILPQYAKKKGKNVAIWDWQPAKDVCLTEVMQVFFSLS